MTILRRQGPTVSGEFGRARNQAPVDRLEARKPRRDRLEALAGRRHALVHPVEQVVLDRRVGGVVAQVGRLVRVVDLVVEPLIGPGQRQGSAVW